MPRLIHCAHGDYGCDSASVVRLSSHAAHGGRGVFSSASTTRVVAVARLAQCAQREVQLAPRNHFSISAAPQILVLNG